MWIPCRDVNFLVKVIKEISNIEPPPSPQKQTNDDSSVV